MKRLIILAAFIAASVQAQFNQPQRFDQVIDTPVFGSCIIDAPLRITGIGHTFVEANRRGDCFQSVSWVDCRDLVGISAHAYENFSVLGHGHQNVRYCDTSGTLRVRWSNYINLFGDRGSFYLVRQTSLWEIDRLGNVFYTTPDYQTECRGN